MQTVSDRYQELVYNGIRPIRFQVKAAFEKQFDTNIEFFTLDESILDGPDLLATVDADEVQIWDQLDYTDYSDRVVSVEVTREELEPYSIVRAHADIVLDNSDGLFTPNSTSPLNAYLIPRRPFKIFIGIGQDVLPKFVGLSEGMPEIDRDARTAKFHLIDFLSYLYDKQIGETIIKVDTNVGEVLDYLFQYMGLLSSQYEIGADTASIPFFYVEKDAKFGDIVEKLIESSLGRLYMSELGKITYRNRYDQATESSATLTLENNVINYKPSEEDQIINKVIVNFGRREVQATQTVYDSSEIVSVAAGQSVDIFVNFDDPVVSIETPAYSAEEITDSYYITTSDVDGNTPYTDITLDNVDLFSKAAKLTFSNTGLSTAYFQRIEIYGDPARIAEQLKLEDPEDTSDSIEKFEERKFEITNEYIQSESDAESRAAIILNDYSEYGSLIDVDMVGNPALQLGDQVTAQMDTIDDNYLLTKIVDVIAPGQAYIQKARIKKRVRVVFFQLDVSELDGTDVLAI